MRKLYRSIAHKNMENRGYKKVNRKLRDGNSFFSVYWRHFVY